MTIYSNMVFHFDIAYGVDLNARYHNCVIVMGGVAWLANGDNYTLI